MLERISRFARTFVSVAVFCMAFGGCPPHSPTWLETLDPAVQSSVLWKADHESGTLYEWHYSDDWPNENPNAGGGVFNTGGDDAVARTSRVVAHSGTYSAEATIYNAFHEKTRAVRLMRWSDKPWDAEPLGGNYFPNEAYYSAWFYFPYNYNPSQYAPWDTDQDGGWWNIFQFKSDDADGVSQPVWVLNVDFNHTTGNMNLYLYSKYNEPYTYLQFWPLPVPVRKWVHLEAYYVNRTDTTGQIIIWQDGIEIFNIDGVRTSLGGMDGNVIWGVGNYTEHIVGGANDGEATVYIDDALVSTMPTHVVR